MVVIVGNFILDFDYEVMSKCLRVPDEKFRDKVYKTLYENLSTFERETGQKPETRRLGDDLAKRYEAMLGPMTYKTIPDPDLVAKADELQAERDTPEWLLANDHRRVDARQVKIRDGVYVIQNMLKTPGGLIRVSAVNEDGKLRDVHISGDFFFYPAEDLPGLEATLNGVVAETGAVTEAVAQFYTHRSVEFPGCFTGGFWRRSHPCICITVSTSKILHFNQRV